MKINTGTQEQFKLFAIEEVVENVLAVLTAKGEQYSQDSSPALSNFIEGSQMLDMAPEQYLMALAQKHWHALCKWSSGNRIFSEADIKERARDIIVYMLLLMFLVHED